MVKLRLVVLLCVVLVGCQASPGTPTSAPLIEGDSSYNIGAEAVQKSEQAMIEKHLNDDDTSNDAFLRLVQDVGGFERLAYRLHTADAEAISQLFEPYGIESLVDVPQGKKNSLSTQRITDCVPTFPKGDRIRHLNVGGTGTNVVIDPYGRPLYAYKWFNPGDTINTTPRTACQTTVGTWGVTGDVGGHLIAASVGGYGGRANIVPQSATFNRGPWYTVEYRAKRCAKSRWLNSYQANAWYSGTTTLRPYAMRQLLTVYNKRRPFHSVDITYYNKAATPEMRTDASNASLGMRLYCP